MSDTYARMRQLYGQSIEWRTNDIVLAEGEIAVEAVSSTETRVKIGDGVRKFSALPYVSDTSAIVSTYLPLAGGTLTGELTLPDQASPTVVLPDHAVSRKWVEANSVTPWASIPEVTANTVGGKAISPATIRYAGQIQGGAGAIDRLVRTDATGHIDNSMLDSATVGGPLASGKVPLLDGNGVLPISLLPPVVQGAMFFKGEFDPSAGVEYPKTPKAGDVWYVDVPADYTFTLGDCAGEIAMREDLMVYDGSRWHLVGKEIILTKLKGYVSKAETISVSQGLADAGKWPRLGAAGRLDSSMFSIPGGMVFKGTIDVTTAAPTGTYKAGDFYIIAADGIAGGAWGSLAGVKVKKGDSVFYTGSDWEALAADVDLNAYLLRDGTAPMLGPITLPGAPTSDAHATTKKYVDDATAAEVARADNKYQTKVAMAAFLTTASASTIYQTIADAAAAHATFETAAHAAATYLTKADAATVYESKADLATTIAGLGSTYETQVHAAATFATKAQLAGYATTASMSGYQTTAAMTNYYTRGETDAKFLTSAAAAATYETKADAATHATLAALNALAARVAALEATLAGVTRSGNDINFPGNICAN